MSLIQVENLTFGYEGSYYNIFENVSFSIDTNWKLGFVARNGKGKTTFLNLLLNKYEYTGKIISKVDFTYFPYEIKDDTVDTLEIINCICSCEHWQILKELSFLNLENEILYRPFYTLSSGEQIKILLLSLFLKENNFLLIDEPTNHLDEEAREIVSKYLKNKKGFILVSHDRTFLNNCVDHILAINKTNIEVQKGNYTSWEENKARRDSFELSENERLKNEIKRLEEASKRTENWSDKTEKTKKGAKNSGLRPDRGYIGHKSAKMMKRSKSIESRQQKNIEEKSGLLKNIERNDDLKIHPLKYFNNTLIWSDDLSVYYSDDNMLFEHLNFTVNQGDRINISGKNGSGKSTLLKLICEENINYIGNFKKGNDIKISYIPQKTDFLKGDIREFIYQNKINENLFRAILNKMDFDFEKSHNDISLFSMGQKKKLLIAKSLCEEAHLYIWDEPLNYIDVFSRIQIENLILRYKPTIVFVEHDSAFCKKVSNKIIKL